MAEKASIWKSQDLKSSRTGQSRMIAEHILSLINIWMHIPAGNQFEPKTR